ncbi:MAG: Periplasmic serine endoprotease DegP [Gammaproteobacteria bacterium]|nr:MAG: Periplasmic serine endoprotease DegP [Gammaproteobacteria bacterium]
MRIYVALLILSTSLNGFADHGARTWETANGSVVSVLPTWFGFQSPGRGAPQGTAPEGSGVVVSFTSDEQSSFILTAAHVVDQATRVQIRDSNGGSLSDAEVVWSDPDSDIALLKTTRARPAFRLKTQPSTPGQHVCVIAIPFGLGISMSCGIVSGPHRRGIGFNTLEDFIQTDAAVNPGASGGALVNADGELLGMVAAIFTKEADIDAGINFAISTELIVERIKQLEIP